MSGNSQQRKIIREEVERVLAMFGFRGMSCAPPRSDTNRQGVQTKPEGLKLYLVAYGAVAAIETAFQLAAVPLMTMATIALLIGGWAIPCISLRNHELFDKFNSRRTAFALACVLLGSVNLVCFGIIRHYHQQQMLNGIKEHLMVTPFEPGSDLNAGYVNLVNGSSSDIRILRLTCNINDLQTLNNEGIRGPFTMGLGDVLIAKDGDGQAFPCIPRGMLASGKPTPIICGDVAWKIVYTVEGDPKAEHELNVRYILPRGDTAWHRYALSNKPFQCNQWSSK
jgi:hypothetical protein